MSVTLEREDDRASRHPRYRIPATVEIDDWRYPVQEWWLEGFSAAGVHGANALAGEFPAKLIFRFDGFSTIVDFDVEVTRHDSAADAISCRFTNLSSQKVAVLRAIIDSYLLGEFVSMDDLIHVVKREESADDEDDKMFPTSDAGPLRAMAKVRRWVGLAFVCALLVSLVGMSLWVGYRRMYVVEAASAVVNAPIVVIRAPQPSFFASVLGHDQTHVQVGQSLANMELVGGGSSVIDSPCNCLVLKQHVRQGQFVSTGEPLLSLMPRGEKAYVDAKVRVEAAKQIALGNRVEITFPSRAVVQGTVTQVLYGEPLERSLSAPLRATSADVISYYRVTVVPDTELDLNLLGVPASVEISTVGNLGSSARTQSVND